MALPVISGEFKLAYDPELKFLPSGSAAVRLRVIAVSRKKADDGEWVDDKKCWLSVVAYGELAEHVAESVIKSDLVEVRGRLVTEEYTDRDGNRRSDMRILADAVAPSLRFRTTPHSRNPVGRATVPEGQSATGPQGGSESPPSGQPVPESGHTQGDGYPSDPPF